MEIELSRTNEKNSLGLRESEIDLFSVDLYNADYRKIDESCAVITKVELKEYKRQAGKEVLESLKEASSRVYPEYIPDIIDEYLENYK